jgi:ribosomal protein L7Ae-like RNA K-turn-binding protein
MNSDALRLLGLALRAGRVAQGEDMTREAVSGHKARLLLLSSDAGESIQRRSEHLSSEKLPLIRLTSTKAELGRALGRDSCAVCALTDLGFAQRIAALLAQDDPALAEAAQLLQRRQEKILRRKKEKPRKKHSAPKKNR